MENHYYFDNAATSWPKPEPVYRFMDEFYRSHGVNPGRSGYALSVEAGQMVDETRRLLAQFFGFAGSHERVVFTLNATDSLNIALHGLLRPGDHVVTTCTEHNSVLRPLHELRHRSEIEVDYLPGDRAGYVDPADIAAAIRRNTRCVAVNHGSNVVGTVQDIAAIGRVTRAAAVPLVVDTCQTAGVLDIDMDASGIDLLAFTGHKGLLGPMGVGGLIVAETVELKPFRSGGTGVDSLSPSQPEQLPYRLEAGTAPLPGIAGLNAAQKWFYEAGKGHIGKGGLGEGKPSHKRACAAALKHIHATESRAVETLREVFANLPQVEVYGPGPGQERVATLSINIGSIPATAAGDMLDADYHVCVRAGLHCAPRMHERLGTVETQGTVRFSPGYFTTEEELGRAIDAVRDLAG